MAPVSKLSDPDVALQAAIDGDLRLLKKVASKANLREAKDTWGRNALHFAAGKGHLAVCRFLVEESGLDVNSTTSGECVRILRFWNSASVPVSLTFFPCRWNASSLRRGRRTRESPGVPARPWRRPRGAGRQGLHAAAEQGHCEAVRLLLSKGVDVDPVNYRGTPLHLAAAKDRDQVVKILLEHGADPNKVVNHVFSPLMMACCGHSLKCMKLLVQVGADVNFISPSGPSILMEAVDDGLTDIVKLLLEAGADPNIADRQWRKIHLMPPC
ncbi:hypothetical protein C2845_PM05G02570 [Panicum miliaceum]|uniref:Uncharacterized protein n=1 Tax=Panicum miliaceum TaxID=4540 RepID=A0A3L6T2K9_PANMI|nr:hypothetical protein C2845_PM05G02570 [Panicum miliaceum]